MGVGTQVRRTRLLALDTWGKLCDCTNFYPVQFWFPACYFCWRESLIQSWCSYLDLCGWRCTIISCFSCKIQKIQHATSQPELKSTSSGWSWKKWMRLGGCLWKEFLTYEGSFSSSERALETETKWEKEIYLEQFKKKIEDFKKMQSSWALTS